MKRFILPLFLLVSSANIFSLNPALVNGVRIARQYVSPTIATAFGLKLTHEALKPIIHTFKDARIDLKNAKESFARYTEMINKEKAELAPEQASRYQPSSSLQWDIDFNGKKSQRTYLQCLKEEFALKFFTGSLRYDYRTVGAALLAGGLITANGLYELGLGTAIEKIVRR
jgi:hypothetical protein